ncbi:MAG: type II secretion system protein [Candidatus Methylomirabilales bacterium]
MKGTKQKSLRNARGFTLVELLVTVALLGVLATVAMPLVEATVQRTNEVELRRALRQVRQGIDRFKEEYDKAKQRTKDAQETFRERVSIDRSGYPLTLEEMVETKILRRIPEDPMTNDIKWVTRSYSDSIHSSLSDGKDVYDIRSASTATGLDGSTYDTW